MPELWQWVSCQSAAATGAGEGQRLAPPSYAQGVAYHNDLTNNRPRAHNTWTINSLCLRRKSGQNLANYRLITSKHVPAQASPRSTPVQRNNVPTSLHTRLTKDASTPPSLTTIIRCRPCSFSTILLFPRARWRAALAHAFASFGSQRGVIGSSLTPLT
jgi:hypothetical protein